MDQPNVALTFLPDELWMEVLCKLDDGDDLASAALVSRRFAGIARTVRATMPSLPRQQWRAIRMTSRCDHDYHFVMFMCRGRVRIACQLHAYVAFWLLNRQFDLEHLPPDADALTFVDDLDDDELHVRRRSGGVNVRVSRDDAAATTTTTKTYIGETRRDVFGFLRGRCVRGATSAAHPMVTLRPSRDVLVLTQSRLAIHHVHVDPVAEHAETRPLNMLFAWPTTIRRIHSGGASNMTAFLEFDNGVIEHVLVHGVTTPAICVPLCNVHAPLPAIKLIAADDDVHCTLIAFLLLRDGNIYAWLRYRGLYLINAGSRTGRRYADMVTMRGTDNEWLLHAIARDGNDVDVYHTHAAFFRVVLGVFTSPAFSHSYRTWTPETRWTPALTIFLLALSIVSGQTLIFMNCTQLTTDAVFHIYPLLFDGSLMLEAGMGVMLLFNWFIAINSMLVAGTSDGMKIFHHALSSPSSSNMMCNIMFNYVVLVFCACMSYWSLFVGLNMSCMA